MIKLIDLIQEGKQVGTLYHYTSYKRMLDIVKSDFIFLPLPHHDAKVPFQHYLSLTRNKNFISSSVPMEVRITLDGNKLAERYKIEPYADTEQGFGRRPAISSYLDKDRGAGEWDEAEERISYKKYPNGIKFKDALLGIELIDNKYNRDSRIVNAYKALVEELDKQNISYGLTSRFS